MNRSGESRRIVNRSVSNNNTIALVKGKLMRQMPDRRELAEAFERNARRIIASLSSGKKSYFECAELPDTNGKPFKFYLIGE